MHVNNRELVVREYEFNNAWKLPANNNAGNKQAPELPLQLRAVWHRLLELRY